MMELTIDDVLKLVRERAQWCRENGESDMRNIIYTVDFISNAIREGVSREGILNSFVDEDEEDW